MYESKGTVSSGKGRSSHVLIIGAGLSGLSCAYHLKKANIEFTILEGSDAAGGRVRSDRVEGFILDRGFQVLLSEYPEAKAMLDYDKLALKSFVPGAQVRYGGRFHTVADPWRRPGDSLKSLFNPIGTLKDKLLIAKLKDTVSSVSLKALYEKDEKTTETYLKQFGFSDRIIERFFRPFFGGVFFDRSLSTSSKMLEFTFRMFAAGETCLPTDGMGAIAQQLVEQVGRSKIQLNSRVAEIKDLSVTLSDGTLIQSDSIVVATEGPEAAKLLAMPPAEPMRTVKCFYFSADRSPLKAPILVLNADSDGPINNLCVPSDVNKSYAPDGKSLISASVIGNDKLICEDLQKQVLNQLESWFGSQVKNWKLLKTYNIKIGLPDNSPPALKQVEKPVRLRDGVYICGDHRETSSIQGALASGRRAAEALIEDFEASALKAAG
jgi:phytoene dehydrogenase-like protein